MKRKGMIVLVCMLLGISGCGNPLQEGTELLSEGKYEEAAEAFQTSIENGQDTASVYEGLGMAYLEAGKYEKALWALEQALGNGAEETPVLYNLAGISCMRCESYQKAAEYFEKGQALDGASEELQKEIAWNLVVSYEKSGAYQKAKEKLEAYLELDPENEKAQKELEFLHTQS